MNKTVSEERRREVYEALITAKNAGDRNPAYSVARQFVLTVLQIEAIEREGIEKKWVKVC